MFPKSTQHHGNLVLVEWLTLVGHPIGVVTPRGFIIESRVHDLWKSGGVEIHLIMPGAHSGAIEVSQLVGASLCLVEAE